MALSTTCAPDPDPRTQISGFTRIGSSAWGPGSDMAPSALKGLALNTNQGAGSIGPVVGAVRPQLELGYQKNLAGTRQPQPPQQLAAISWCRSHAYRATERAGK